jgi:tetratricopeptide (TPR) repeat protein
VLKAQGDVLAFLDQRQEALERYDQALGLFRQVGARLGEANVLQAQGDAALRAGETEQGLRLLDEARGLYAAIGARAGLSNVGIVLARHAAAQGDYAAAIEYMQPAADFGIEVDHPLGPQLQAEIEHWKAQLEQQQALARLLEQWQSVIAAVAAAAQGDAEATRQLAPFLDQMGATTDWGNLVAALRRVLAGERDPEALAEGLDTTDRVILAATLAALAQATAPELTAAELKPQLEQAVAALRQQGDRERLIQALAALRAVCTELKDWPGVVAAAEELAALGAADADTWAGLGDARSNLNDEAGAAEAYARAVALAPDQALLRRNYANTLIALGRLDEATAQLDAAEAPEPDAPYLALRRAELAKARGDRADATAWAQEALRRRPGWEEAQAVLAWAEARRKSR